MVTRNTWIEWDVGNNYALNNYMQTIQRTSQIISQENVWNMTLSAEGVKPQTIQAGLVEYMESQRR